MYKNGILAIILSLMIALSFSGCVDNTAQTSGETVKTVEIVDLAGRTVEVPEDVEKIVCSGPGALRLVTYLQADDMLVGVESCEQADITGAGKQYALAKPYTIANVDYFKTLPTIGTQFVDGLNCENIVNVNPDVIIISMSTAGVADNIQTKTGIPVVVLDYDEFESFTDKDLADPLTLLGKVLNREERAQAVIDFFADAENDISNRISDVSDSEKPSVYVGGLNAAKGSHGIESTSSVFAPFEVLKAKNVAESIETKKQVYINKEQLIEWNPDIIFIDIAGYTSVINEDYEKNPEYYESLSAFKNGDVYLIYRYKSYMVDYGTVLANTYYIGTVLYPEEFSDIDPEAKADEIYEFLVGEAVYDKMAENFEGYTKLNLN
ncbi:iron ABC transporter substrate-binding protein [Methanococcus maripaludis]|uniref:Iron ABC transporter substrate-binding protein n=2 Tax=Methanococcus maripaludis TaxID=39152 RepID=A0A8T3VXZ9_METMI|nr:iron ABC transporter substrate-binding protein [Methanococcus maripaludis]MBG0768781.1 iron ABC transporter substrate-binding protein [Methanococcus maripaludis]BAP63375.1 putative iron compound ABC transporter periplasmic binding protein [Methanococcus maripaludis OS7]